MKGNNAQSKKEKGGAGTPKHRPSPREGLREASSPYLLPSHRHSSGVTHTHILGALLPGCGFRQQGATGVCSGKSLQLGNNRPRSESRLCYFLTIWPPAK